MKLQALVAVSLAPMALLSISMSSLSMSSLADSGPATPSIDDLRSQFQAAHLPNTSEIKLDDWQNIWTCQNLYARENGGAFTARMFQFRSIPENDVLVYNNGAKEIPGEWFPGFYAFLDGNFFTTVPFKTKRSPLSCSGNIASCDLSGQGVLNNIYVRATGQGRLLAEWTVLDAPDAKYVSIANPAEKATLYSVCDFGPATR